MKIMMESIVVQKTHERRGTQITRTRCSPCTQILSQLVEQGGFGRSQYFMDKIIHSRTYSFGVGLTSPFVLGSVEFLENIY